MLDEKVSDMFFWVLRLLSRGEGWEVRYSLLHVIWGGDDNVVEYHLCCLLKFSLSILEVVNAVFSTYSHERFRDGIE